MFKKLLFWSALAVGGLVLINTVKPGAVATWGKRIHAKLESNLSPEFELARIKDQIKKLTPDMHKNIGKIAEEMVKVDTLRTQVADMQARLDTQKADIQTLTAALERGDLKKTGFISTDLTPARIKAKLRAYDEGVKTLETTKHTLALREQKLESARQQLIEVKKQQEKLEGRVAEFEAVIEALNLEKTKAKFVECDTTRLGEIKEALENLRQRVEAERTKVRLTGEFFGIETTKDEKSDVNADDVINEVKGRFDEKKDK